MAKKTISKGEMMFYLEEMMSMCMISDFEETVYFDIKEGKQVSKEDLLEVARNMNYWYENKFQLNKYIK